MLICVGTYEHILYGWELDFDAKNASLASSKVAFALPAHTGYIRCISTAGRHLVTGGTDEVIKVFDLKRRRELGTLTHHAGTVTSLGFYSTTHLITCAMDGAVHVLRTKDWEPLLCVGKHKKSAVESIAVHPSGRLAVTLGKEDRLVKAWDLQVGKQAASSWSPVKDAFFLQWSADGACLLMLSESQLCIFQATNLDVPMAKFEGKKLLTATFFKTEAGHGIVYAGEGSAVSVVDLANPEDIRTFDSKHEPRVKCINATERHVVTSSTDGVIRVWKLSDIQGLLLGQQDPLEPIAEHNCDLRITCMTVSAYAA